MLKAAPTLFVNKEPKLNSEREYLNVVFEISLAPNNFNSYVVFVQFQSQGKLEAKLKVLLEISW